MKNLQGFLFFRVRGGQLVIMLPKYYAVRFMVLILDNQIFTILVVQV